MQGALRMEKLLKDLRTYMLVSSTEDDPAEEIDAGEVLKKTLADLEIAIQDSGAEISSSALPRVRMYEFQLEQFFQNLIGNAIRYRSHLPPSIHIAARMQDQDWLFSLQDNGIGSSRSSRSKSLEFLNVSTAQPSIPAQGWVLQFASGLPRGQEGESGSNQTRPRFDVFLYGPPRKLPVRKNPVGAQHPFFSLRIIQAMPDWSARRWSSTASKANSW